MLILVEEGRGPDAERDPARMDAILDEHIRRYEREFPAPSENVLARQVRDLREATRIFLTEQGELCREGSPMYLEASIGLPSEDPPTALDTRDPVTLTVPGDRSIRLRGRVDRVDRLNGAESSSYAVWDYKTGSTYCYEQPDPFRQGRALQHALYIRMVNRRLAEVAGPGASVARFGYFFPGVRGLGRSVVRTPSQLADGDRILGLLCDIIAGGSFLPTDDEDDCKYCDFRSICGDIGAVTQRSAVKLADEKNAELAAMRELRGK